MKLSDSSIFLTSKVSQVLLKEKKHIKRIHERFLMKSGIMAHACNPSTWEAESGASGVQGNGEFAASLGYRILLSLLSQKSKQGSPKPEQVEDASQQAWALEFYPRDAYDRNKGSSYNTCPLTSKCMLWLTNTRKKFKKCNLKKKNYITKQSKIKNSNSNICLCTK